MSTALLGADAAAWVHLVESSSKPLCRLVLTDVDGVITPGEGQPADLQVLARLAEINRAARHDACVPAVTLCTGRQAPYVELMAQMTGTFLPCIFEHGAGLFFPTAFRYLFHPRLGPRYAADLAALRAALAATLLDPGRAFVQPGKEASMTLYPLGSTSLDEIMAAASEAIERTAAHFDVARNMTGIEVRPAGIDKGEGARWLAEVLGVPLAQFAGVGDSDPDLGFLQRVGFSAAPANATPAIRASVAYVASAPHGAGLLEIVALVERRNRQLLEAAHEDPPPPAQRLG